MAAYELWKVAFLLLVQIVLIVKVQSQEDLPCNEEKSKSISCPDIVCKIMNSRKTDFCKDITCEGITPDNCTASNSIYENSLTMCGCCPGCAKYLAPGEPCDVSSPDPSPDPDCTDPFCPIRKNECEPPYACKYLGEPSKVCTLDTSTPIEGEAPESCEARRNLGMTGDLYWTPSCDEDGTYSPKQCKGVNENGICFCSDPDGNRIFGREWLVRSENQTCACSRQAWTLQSQNNIAALHCSYDGNYEPLQCDMDSGVCYCVETQTGKLTGAVLPEHKWKDLPCFSLNLTNGDPTGTYLRFCESELVAVKRVRTESLLHGLDVLSGRDIMCDFDGAFGPMRRDKGQMFCCDRTGGLSAFFQEIDREEMNCQCYRDSLLYIEQGRPFLKTCVPGTGNYPPIAMVDEYEGSETYSCIDRDGIYFGDLPTPYRCCLSDDPIDNCPTNPECYNPATNPNGIRTCSFWLQ